MISVGLDLSLTHTGVAVLKDEQLVYSAVIKSKPSGPRPSDELVRIATLCARIAESISDNVDESPDIVVIEGLAFMARNTTALVQLAGMNYIIRLILESANIPFAIVAPTSLKKFITGKGVGDKNIILMEIYKRYGHTFLDDNEADAFGLAMIGLALKDSHSKELTQPQKEVVTLVKTQL